MGKRTRHSDRFVFLREIPMPDSITWSPFRPSLQFRFDFQQFVEKHESTHVG